MQLILQDVRNKFCIKPPLHDIMRNYLFLTLFLSFFIVEKKYGTHCAFFCLLCIFIFLDTLLDGKPEVVIIFITNPPL